MMATLHIFRDRNLLGRVRLTVKESCGKFSLSQLDSQELVKNPLLSSIYAETLRLYVQCYFVVSSPHHDVPLGKWWLPKGNIGLVNSGISHMDEHFWNTKCGAHPVHSFWAERFLKDPLDAKSGPINPGIQTQKPDRDRGSDEKESFSLENLEGSWIPFGGELVIIETLGTAANT